MDDRTFELLEDVLEWLQTGKIHGTVVDRETVVDVVEATLITVRATGHEGHRSRYY